MCVYIYTYTCTYVCIYSIQTYIVYGCERNSHVRIKLCDRRSSVFRSAIWWKPQQIKRSGLWAGVWHFGQLLVRHQTGTTGKLGDWKSWILIHYGKPLDSCVNLLDLYFFIGFAFAIILSTERLSSTPLSRNQEIELYPQKKTFIHIKPTTTVVKPHHSGDFCCPIPPNSALWQQTSMGNCWENEWKRVGSSRCQFYCNILQLHAVWCVRWQIWSSVLILISWLTTKGFWRYRQSFSCIISTILHSWDQIANGLLQT